MPEERRMTITSSWQLVPDDVARHTFASVRRGFDPSEVRDYLESIAIAMRGIAEREQQLLDELAEAERRAANPVLDEPTLTAAVGQETARVLHSAHEAADEMVANARAEATRMLAEATEEATRVLGEATEEAGRLQTTAAELLAVRTAEAEVAVTELLERAEGEAVATLDAARADADELVARARDECKAMVEEAQQLRARVLADFSRRRKILHSQIEQLRAGRERLAETIVDVRRSVDTIADDLFVAEDEARRAAEEAAREVASRPDEGTPEEVAALALAEEAAANEAAAASASLEVDTGEEDAVTSAMPAPGESVDELFARLRAAQIVPESVPPEAGSDAEPEGRERGPEASKQRGPKAATGSAEAESETAGPSEPGAAAPVTATESPTEEIEEEEATEGPPEGRNPAAVRRDELVAPIVTVLARRLKRTLQDNQNELLDRARSNGYRWSAELLTEETEHVDGYATAAMPALEEASEAGVVFVGTGAASGAPADALVGIADDLAHSVVDPLRRRLADADGLADGDESAVVEHVGSAFREWKGERIERLAGDSVVGAFSLGSLSAVEVADAGRVEWIAVAASGDAACPDCEDNGLGGALQPGESFPTGHRHPPAHPGCRCLLAMTAT
jgi:DivIVA domain-containing protein